MSSSGATARTANALLLACQVRWIPIALGPAEQRFVQTLQDENSLTCFPAPRSTDSRLSLCLRTLPRKVAWFVDSTRLRSKERRRIWR